MTISNVILKRQHMILAIIALISFFSIALMTPSVNVGYKDSDEFIVLAKEWGIAHPPGYILFTTALHTAFNLPIPGTTAIQRTHLVSAVSFAIALYLVGASALLINKKVFASTKKFDQGLSLIAASLSMLALAGAKIPALYAQIVQPYVFSLPFIAALVYLSLKILLDIHSLKTFVILGFVYGLLLSHQLSALLLIPILVFTIAIKRIKSPALILTFMLSIVIGYSFSLMLLLYRLQANVGFSWPVEPSIQGLIQFVSQTDLTHHLTNVDPRSKPILPPHSTPTLTRGTLHYFYTLFSSFTWWIIVPLILSMVVLFKKNRRVIGFFLIPFTLLSVGIAGYFGLTDDISNYVVVAPLSLASFVIVTPLIGVGIAEILRRLHKSAKELEIKPIYTLAAVSALIAVTLIFIALKTHQAVSLKSFTQVSRLYSNILDNVPENSLVTCYSDHACFALHLEQIINNHRGDATIIPMAFPYVSRHISPEIKGFSYTENPWFLHDIISWNLDKRPVVAVGLNSEYSGFFSVDQGVIYYVPTGYSAIFTKQLPQQMPVYDISLLNDIPNQSIPSFDYNRQSIIQSFAQIHFSNAYMLLKTGLRERAQAELNMAMKISYVLPENQRDNAQSIRNSIERTLAEDMFKAGSESPKVAKMLEFLPNLYKQKKMNAVFRIVRGAVLLEPQNLNARLELARYYTAINDEASSKREYQHVLILDANNQEAKTKLGN